MAGVGRLAQTGVPTMIMSYSLGDFVVGDILVSLPFLAFEPPVKKPIGQLRFFFDL